MVCKQQDENEARTADPFGSRRAARWAADMSYFLCITNVE
jgi:hypothetical protein